MAASKEPFKILDILCDDVMENFEKAGGLIHGSSEIKDKRMYVSNI